MSRDELDAMLAELRRDVDRATLKSDPCKFGEAPSQQQPDDFNNSPPPLDGTFTRGMADPTKIETPDEFRQARENFGFIDQPDDFVWPG